MHWDEQRSDDGGALIIKLTGEIDLRYSPALRELLTTKSGDEWPVLLLDFAEVTYIDSSGMATLVEYFQRAQSFSGKLAIAAPTDRVRSTFELVRLNEIFQFFATVEEGLNDLSKS